MSSRAAQTARDLSHVKTDHTGKKAALTEIDAGD
jgi:hypothetical protein